MLVENLWVGYKQLKVDCQELPLVPGKYSRYHPEEIEHQVQCNDFEIVERIEVALEPEYCKFLSEISHVDGVTAVYLDCRTFGVIAFAVLTI
jgi:hypothetical protein